jgi:hypothetical protein
MRISFSNCLDSLVKYQRNYVRHVPLLELSRYLIENYS